MYYFAYGSNMDEKRMIERGVKFLSKEKGTLNGYRFVINKKSQKNPNIGFANIIKDNNSEIEGIIYEVDYEDIIKLDRFEGFPNHYSRDYHLINDKQCIVYIANNKWLSLNELETTEEYKNHILEGKMFLSSEYYNKLLKIKTI
jgi:gamma-glutamylcyclotransferase